MSKKKKEKKAKVEIAEVVKLGKCLKCGIPMVKNHLSCGHCNKKRRLRAKANRRGLHKDYYL